MLKFLGSRSNGFSLVAFAAIFVALIACSFCGEAHAQAGGGVFGPGSGGTGLGGGNGSYSFGLPSAGGPGIRFSVGPVGIQFGGAADSLVEDTACVILGMTEGRFAALIMCVAGLVAIVSASVGAYRLALSTIVVAVGSWILRPVVEMFFGDMCGFRVIIG